MLRPFAGSGYRWLWFSNAAASAGRWALVLVLSSQLLLITHSSFWVGLGLFLTQGPVILLAPFSGVLADRLDRRTLNVVSALLSALTTGLFALLTWLHLISLPLTLLLALVYGLSFVFQMTLRSTLVPSLVSREGLLGGISLFQVGTQGAQFLGPALATPLLVRGGPALAWAFCSLLYATSAVLAAPIGEIRATLSANDAGARLAASLEYLRARPLAWTAIWAVSLHCALTMGYQGMLPMFVEADLRGSASDYGVLLAAIGLGAVTGSFALAQLSAARFRPGIFSLSLVGSGACLAGLGASRTLPPAVVFGFLAGGTQAMFMSITLALIQGSVSDEYRGRATSFYQMITMAPMAVFGWGMGGLADVTEPRPLMVVSGLAFVVVMAGFAALSPWLRSLFRAASAELVPAPAEP